MKTLETTTQNSYKPRHCESAPSGRNNPLKLGTIILVLMIFISQAGVAQWSTNGSNVYYNGGNVGIGVAAPLKKLEVWTGQNDYASIGNWLPVSSYSGLHFGYIEANALYRKSALVFERTDGAARGKIHLLNNSGVNSASATLADAKFTIDPDGLIGIGNASPTEKLDVGGYDKLNIRVGQWATLGILGSHLATVLGNNVKASTVNNNMEILTTNANDGAKAIKMQYNEGITFHTQIGSVTAGAAFSNERMRIDNAGDIGIGTTNPNAKLDIRIELPIQAAYNAQNWSTNNNNYNLRLQTVWDSNGISQRFVQKSNGTDYQVLSFLSGNVGIGTTSPDAKLAVNGTVHAKEVRVDLSVPGPDYVFDADYPLQSLEDIETFIKQNKHLPEVPSAKQLKNEGIMVGEMNMLLLKKIEEMTLYMIELKAEVQAQQAEIENLKSKK